MTWWRKLAASRISICAACKHISRSKNSTTCKHVGSCCSAQLRTSSFGRAPGRCFAGANWHSPLFRRGNWLLPFSSSFGRTALLPASRKFRAAPKGTAGCRCCALRWSIACFAGWKTSIWATFLFQRAKFPPNLLEGHLLGHVAIAHLNRLCFMLYYKMQSILVNLKFDFSFALLLEQ